jgi:hypothetical protein
MKRRPNLLSIARSQDCSGGAAAHVPMAPQEHDEQAKQFKAAPDKASLYV